MKIPFKGTELSLELEKSPFGTTKVRANNDKLVVQVSSIFRDPDEIVDEVIKRVNLWLRAQARLAVTKEVEKQRNKFGFDYNEIRIKDTKSRWGSCSSANNLNFSWRLILAKPKVIQYLVTHETAHLTEMNHSDDFWRLVKNRMEDFNEVKNYLKVEGGRLMAWRLDSPKILEKAKLLWK